MCVASRMACQVWSEKWVIFINRFHKPNRIIGNICLSVSSSSSSSCHFSKCVARRCVARVATPRHECMLFNAITIKVIIMIMLTHSLQADRWINKQTENTSSLPNPQLAMGACLGLNFVCECDCSQSSNSFIQSMDHSIIPLALSIPWHFPKSFSGHHSSPIFNYHCCFELRIDH